MSPSSKPARKWPIWARRWLRRLGWTGAGFVVLVLLLLGTFELVVRARAYPVGDLAPRADSQRLRDARGGLLREAVNGQGTRAAWVALTEMSPLVIDATIAVEDARFFSHDGIDRIGVLRASFDALRHGRAVIPLPAAGNLVRQNGSSSTAVVVQHAEDGFQDGHEAVFQSPAAKHQYRCFLQSLTKGTPMVPEAADAEAACN